MISSQKSILWPYQYSLSISTTSPISRYLEEAIIWEVKIYIFNSCKKRHKAITYGFQVPRVPTKTQEWMQEVWGLHTWGKIVHFHGVYLLLIQGAGGGQCHAFTYEWNLPRGWIPGKISPHLAHCMRGGYVCLWPGVVVKVVLKLKLQQNSKWNKSTIENVIDIHILAMFL